MRIFYLLCFLFFIASGEVKSQQRFNSPYEETKATRFFPNPAANQITFNFEKGYDKNYSFLIFNFIGKKVFEIPALTASTIIDLSNFYRGIYIFQIRDRTGRIVESGRFQVAR